MEQSSFRNKITVMHQYDRLCKMALKSEVINYKKTCGISPEMGSDVVRAVSKRAEQTFYNGQI